MQERALAAQREREATPKARLTLGEWIPTVSPGYSNPKHLQPLLDVFARIDAGESVRVVLHAPPRHAKTDTLMHGVPWLLERHPSLRAGYFSYADDLSKEKSRNSRRIAETTGIHLDKDTEGRWTTPQGGGLIADGVDGIFTGRGVNLLIMDDLFKNRPEAESARIRERRWEWLEAVAYTRLEPNASVIACGTRWHPDDVQGRLLKAGGWEDICLPALLGEQEESPLWPERWTVEQLRKICLEVGPYTWESLYRGKPYLRGGKVFEASPTVEKSPTGAMRYAIGIDLAYSENTHSDYSVIVVLAKVEDVCHVMEVHRHQEKSPAFKARLREVCRRFPTARVVFRGAGPEKGTVDLMRTKDGQGVGYEGINVEFYQVRTDKFLNAQPVSIQWNIGKLRVPPSAPWLQVYLEELRDFTGFGDKHDDMVDATGNAYEVLRYDFYSGTSTGPPPAEGTTGRRM